MSEEQSQGTVITRDQVASLDSATIDKIIDKKISVEEALGIKKEDKEENVATTDNKSEPIAPVNNDGNGNNTGEDEIERLSKLSKEELIEEYKKAKKSAEEKQKIIGRQGKELGDVRKELDEQISEKEAIIAKMETGKKLSKEELAELMLEDPEKALDLRDSQTATSKELEFQKLELMSLQNKAAVLNRVPEFENLLDDMKEVLAEDGLSGKDIKNFIEYPYYTDVVTLVQIAKRAEAVKERNELKAKVADLEAKLNAAASNIVNAGKQPTLNNSAGSSYAKANPTGILSRADVMKMSDKELDEYIKKK